MSDPSLEIQAAIVAALKTPGALPAVQGDSPPRYPGIYDAVPQNALFPYITLGDCQVLPDKASCIDGVEVYPQIDVWSRAVGYPETKTIAKAILAALDDGPIVVSGFNVVLFEYERIQYLRDPDGLTRHAAITFHGLLTPA